VNGSTTSERPCAPHKLAQLQLHSPFSVFPHSPAWTANPPLIALGRRHQRKTNHARLPIPISFDIYPCFPEFSFRLTPSLLPYFSIYFSPFLPLGQHCIVQAAVMRQLYAPFFIFDDPICRNNPFFLSLPLCVRCKTTRARFLPSEFTVTFPFSLLIISDFDSKYNACI
jgi:hypothetical protein